MNPRDAMQEHVALIAALKVSPDLAGEGDVELIETHISSVLLAGDYAYKIKKPVNFGFVDFSTVELRRHFCEEELRLNRRTAAQIYLGVVPIAAGAQGPEFAGAGELLDYAVRMRRFASDALFDALAKRGALTPGHVDALARVVSDFHARIPVADPAGPFGTPEQVLHWALQALDMPGLQTSSGAAQQVQALTEWTQAQAAQLHATFTERQARGCVRECHGDLHLGNIVLTGDVPVPFDAIEFNAQLRWIDVMSDVAFTFMDLFDHGLPRLAWRFVNAWLDASGDHAGVATLRFYAVYRAAVRAKVALLRGQQAAEGSPERARRLATFERRLALARTLAQQRHPALYVMSGVSGSGKTTVAQILLERAGAVRLRSDVERKRLYGQPATARLEGDAVAAMYGADANTRTYARLAELASCVIGAGWPVVIDAACLRRNERDAFRALARELAVPFWLVECDAPTDLLRARVARRAAAHADASDATVAVLERQLASREILADDERAYAWRVDTSADLASIEQQVAEAIGGVGDNPTHHV